MKSVFARKQRNIVKTFALFGVFLVVVIGAGWFFSTVYANSTILYIAVGISVLMATASYWWSDRLVLAMSRAKPVRDTDMPELYSVVKRLTQKAGLPMPRLYVVPERAPNAFATGRSPKKAVVAVTEGLLERLNAEELEGVIAHELSHIGNRDILVSTVAVILAGFISILSDFFLRSLFFRSMFGGRDNSEGGRLGLIIAIGLAVLVPIGALLMRLAISRKRESLADISGAQLTRQPEWLARALQKISADPTPMRVAGNTTAHLWIANPFKGKEKTSLVHRLFMSHPPVEERVKVLRSLRV